MSYRILNAYIYDKSEDELMQELNSIRSDYLKFMKEVIDKQADWFIKFGNSMYKRFAKRNEDILDKAIRVIEKSAYGVERGNPADFSSSCTVIKHDGKIVLWFSMPLDSTISRQIIRFSSVLKRMNIVIWTAEILNSIPRKKRKTGTSAVNFGMRYLKNTKPIFQPIWA